jgi:fibrillarin-like pre-rRNA processing protein
MKTNWNEYTSKWKAAKKLGLDVSLKEKDNILYIGASSGNTVNQISKLTKGIIFAVEISSKMAIGLIKLTKTKNNIAPIIEDARKINSIKNKLFNTKINILFQDIPTKDQIDILINTSKSITGNYKIFFVLKTQSISNQDSEKTFLETNEKLKKHFEILEVKSLEPFQKKHYFFILKKLKY